MTITRTPVPSSLASASARDALIEEASRALHAAHLAVGDAAGAWYDEGGAALPRSPRRLDGPEAAAADLARAIERWRAAGDAFMRAMRGGA